MAKKIKNEPRILSQLASFHSAFRFPSPDNVVVFLSSSSSSRCSCPPSFSPKATPKSPCRRALAQPVALGDVGVEGGRKHGSSQALRTNTSLPPSLLLSVLVGQTNTRTCPEEARTDADGGFLRSPGRRFPLLPSKRTHPSSKFSMTTTLHCHFNHSDYVILAQSNASLALILSRGRVSMHASPTALRALGGGFACRSNSALHRQVLLHAEGKSCRAVLASSVR